jgi:hypothetical protein
MTAGDSQNPAPNLKYWFSIILVLPYLLWPKTECSNRKGLRNARSNTSIRQEQITRIHSENRGYTKPVEMASWCSWLSHQSNTLKVPRSSLGEVIPFCVED